MSDFFVKYKGWIGTANDSPSESKIRDEIDAIVSKCNRDIAKLENNPFRKIGKKVIIPLSVCLFSGVLLVSFSDYNLVGFSLVAVGSVVLGLLTFLTEWADFKRETK